MQRIPDYYMEGGFKVYTESFHIKRGWCCGNGCRHCPYFPKHKKFNKNIYDTTKNQKTNNNSNITNQST